MLENLNFNQIIIMSLILSDAAMNSFGLKCKLMAVVLTYSDILAIEQFSQNSNIKQNLYLKASKF